MKRSDFFIRLTTGVLFLAVACYIGVYVYDAAINTYVTTSAVSYVIEEAFPAKGYIVRTETVITDSGDTILPIVSEGEKVASGQAVAVEYMSRAALETASEIHELRLRIARIEAPSESADAVKHDSILALSAAVHGGDLSMLDKLSLDIETFVFTGITALEDQLPALRARLELLERRSAGMRTIFAPVGGVYSQVVDGYEHIGPRALSEITPASLEELFHSRSGVTGAGKLVTEFKWYYAAVMDAESAKRLTVGRQIEVHFSGVYNTGVQMRIESVGKSDEGQCVVLFTSDIGVHEMTQLRDLRADIVYDTVTGIRVPKEAIHLDEEGTTYVYLQSGVRAERVSVEILSEAGDSYLVRDGIEAGTPLRAGSTIIVKANNLFDGKIVA